MKSINTALSHFLKRGISPSARVQEGRKCFKQGQKLRHFTTQEPKSNWKNNGVPEMIIGTTILALVGIDTLLQQQQEASKQEIILNLKSAMRNDEARDKEKSISDISSKRKTLFECVIRRIPKYFDGSKCLMNVEVGDKVSIIEERVGPDGMYHLCRLERNEEKDVNNDIVQTGWFPISCLEKLG